MIEKKDIDNKPFYKSDYKEFRIKLNSLYEPYKMDGMELAIVELWEYRPKELLLFTATNKNILNKENS